MSILPIGFISHPVDFKISCTYTSPFNSTLIEIYGDIIRVSQGIDGCQMLEYIAGTFNSFLRTRNDNIIRFFRSTFSGTEHSIYPFFSNHG